MKLLILGGTQFLGRHLTEAGQKRGHDITLFNRGLTDPGLFLEAERLKGDRNGGLEALEGRSWDVVIDTCGYVPRIVGYSVDKLHTSCRRYIFISSISVYRDFSEEGIDELAPVAELEDSGSEDVSAHYGALKALCEQEVLRGFGQERSLIIRPGLIAGPFDPTDRFTYWPVRMAQGGAALVPGRKDRPVQFIDVRDLAEWIIRLAESQAAGIFNAVGPDKPLCMEELVEACRSASPSAAEPVWVEESFLLEQGVQDWKDLPLWLADNRNSSGFFTVSGRKASEQGLTCRPVGITVSDTLEWALSRKTGKTLKTGLTRDREAELLGLWSKVKRC